MISKKVLPLMGISVLLLLVNLPQVDANLCGDEITVKVLDAAGDVIFMNSAIAPLDSGFFITPDVVVSFSVQCNGLIFWDYVNPDIIDDHVVPAHSFWFTDLMWTDSSGKVVDFFVDPNTVCETNIMTTGFTDTSVHSTIDQFIIPAEDFLQCDLQIISQHAVGGEISPITTSALLLAGAQNSMAWMIPVIVSAIGIGIVIARKF